MVIASVVFLLSVGVTLLGWHVILVSMQASASRAFEEQAARAENAIVERMRGYEQVMRGGAGLFAASVSVNRDEWHRYVMASRVRESFPGLRGINFAPRVAANDIAAHIAAVRREDFPNYSVRPEGAREEYYPLVWPEPLDTRGRAGMGLDLYAEPVRRAAMQRARDSGKPTISGKLMLVGDDGKAAPGFVYFFPVYGRDSRVGTVEERRRATIGFIFCAFRFPEMMDGLIGKERDILDVEIYDGNVPSEEALIYDDDGIRRAFGKSSRDVPWQQRELTFGGHSWTAYFEATANFMKSVDSTAPRWLLLVGFIMSIVITALIWRLLTSEALALAASLNDGLTGLYNRRFLEASLKREEDRALRNKYKVSIVQMDIDHFKKLNDEHGHAAGDEVLRCVGEVLRAATRGEDIVCRYGGEEFTLILPGATRANAESRAVTIGKHIRGLEVSMAGKPIPGITISGGVAVYPDDGPNLLDVLRRADQALLRAKREGRARILMARPDDPTTAQLVIYPPPQP